MADRERRKAARQNDLARRRGTMDIEDDDEAERRAQADDEEVCIMCPSRENCGGRGVGAI